MTVLTATFLLRCLGATRQRAVTTYQLWYYDHQRRATLRDIKQIYQRTYGGLYDYGNRNILT